MNSASSTTPSQPVRSFAARIVAVALVLSLLLLTEPPLFAQPAAPQQGWPQGPQYSTSPYIQTNPNYVANSQYKPTPYQYPQQPTYQQPADPQGNYQQPQGSYPQPGTAQQPAYPQQGQFTQQEQGQYAQQPYSPQQDAYPQPQQYAQQPDYAQQPYADPSGDDPQQAYAQPQQAPQPFAADQLEQLVAPIALYPDALVAQILAASTYPAQVAAADQWVRSMGYTSAQQVADGATAQTGWDPSVKALTAFPQVLDMMNHDLRWTTDLGNAYYNQPQDVLQTIQVMRQRAQSAGTLQSTPQEQVSDNQGYIQLAPTNPEVVYVPAYNPWAVYGQPVTPYPGFSWSDALGAIGSVLGTGLRFGSGIGLAAFMHTPFGWAGWALNWLASAIFFNHSPYYSQSTSVAHWGGGRGGYYGSRMGVGGINRQPRGFPRPEEGYNRSGNSFGNRYGSGAQAFNRPEARGYENYGTNHAFENPRRAFAGNDGRTTLRDPGRDIGRSYGEARPQPLMPRQQAYASPRGYDSRGLGYGYGSRSYAEPQRSFASPQQFGRGQAFSAQRNEFAQHAYAEPRGFSGGHSFAQPFRQELSGGSHFFGGHGGGGFHESFHAPKAPKAPKFSGGGHHGGGGHFGGHHGR